MLRRFVNFNGADRLVRFVDFYEAFYCRGRGVKFKYFHLESCCINVLLWFIVCRI